MGKHSLAETREHLQRGEGNLGLLMVLAHRAAHLSADAGSRVKMLSSPGFPLPGTEDPPQEDRQTDRQAHLPTPRYHCRPSSCSTPKLFKASKAAQAQAQPLLSLPPLPAFTSSALLSSKKSWRNTQAPLPTELFPSTPVGKSRSKHSSTYFCAGVSGEKGTGRRKAQPSPARNGSVSARADDDRVQDVGHVTAPEDERAAGHPGAHCLANCVERSGK